MAFQAHTRIELADSERVIAQVCEHLIEHDAEVEDVSGGKMVRFQGSAAHIVSQEHATRIEVSAPTLEGLYFMRLAIVSHIREFTEDGGPAIEWAGDGQELVRPPNFRVLDVVSVRDITPHMRRLTLSGPDIERYAPLSALHVNLVIPHRDATSPQWPHIGPDGTIAWPDPDRRPARRKYTVRAVDPAAGTLDIDFVLHEDAGPGSAFALTARPGDQIGMIGPGGGGLTEADWYLFAGDETALPAIAHMLESLPASARGKAIIEVSDTGEIQPLSLRAAIDVEWLCRSTARTGLASAVKSVAIPEDGSTIHVWAGCEYDDFREIRRYLRKERGLRPEQHLVVSYWRRGRKEDEE